MTISEKGLIQEAKRVLHVEASAIRAFEKKLLLKNHQNAFLKALFVFEQGLLEKGRIIFSGVGKSAKIAEKIAATFRSLGSSAFFIHPTEALHGDLGGIQAQDRGFFMSHSGQTKEVLDLFRVFQSWKVPVVGLGGQKDSFLAKSCEVWIDASISKEACPHNLAPTASTTLALAIGDALALCLMKKRGLGEKTFAKLHPGGALGKRLGLKVKDLMHQKVACVRPEDSVSKVLKQGTQKNLGGVFVCQGKQLCGVITDGDLRRHLHEKKEVFFSLQAKDIMTKSPVWVDQDAQAIEALRLMEARKSQIAVLPVMNAQKNFVGLIRLHDLVKIF